ALRPCEESEAIFFLPYFLRPIEAAKAPGLVTPGCEASLSFSAANLPPLPKGALEFGFAMLFLRDWFCEICIDRHVNKRQSVYANFFVYAHLACAACANRNY